jgi:acetyl-CoA carboxylase biotin carboxyl carrier protein
MALSDEDVREILRIIDESDLDELQVDTEGFSLHVRKSAGHGVADPQPAPPLPAPKPAAAAPPAPEPQDGAVTIDSPMLGTFYRAESPGGEPFVEIGSVVETDTIVCIIEVMKMMNSIPAGIAGEVVDVFHEDGELVEYGAPLFRVRPA